MNLTKQLLWGTLAAVAAHGLSSCSDNDSPAEAPSFSYEVIAEAQTAYGDTTKAAGKTTLALTESAGNLLSEFKTTERLMGFNLSSDGSGTSRAAAYSLLTPTSNGWSSNFTGTVTGTRAPQATDNFAFFYPGTARLMPAERVQKTYGGRPYVLYQQRNTIKPILEVDLTHQDGTLATISQKYDYQWAKAKPTSVAGNTVNIAVGKLQRKIAIWGLRFTDPNNNPIANIDSVNISEVKGSEHLDLATGNFVTDNQFDETWGISLEAKSAKFTSVGGKYTYAALLPGNYKNVIVTVYVGNKIYQREYPTLSIEADRFYKTDILKMQLVSQRPYVEVAGIKWATGNFIYYTKNNREFWGIAPTQWWISGHAITVNNAWTSTQFQTPNYPTDPEDRDLFRFGDIVKAHEVKASSYKAGNVEIQQKFYAQDGAFQNTEVSREQANFGDLVYYHTMNYKDIYRYPSFNELSKLFNEASVIPAYCYATRGIKIYGAYFYNTPVGETRVNNYPPGSREVEKFKDVTNLVRANKGLFLPIAGWSPPTTTDVQYRNLTTANAVGKYMTGKSLSVGSDVFEFGTASYGKVNVISSQRRAIRAVWVGNNRYAQATNPTHPDFKGLQ